MRRIIAAAMLTGLCFAPAFAQTKTPAGTVDAAAECQANFKAADKDGNGTLNKSEMTAAGKIIPSSLLTQSSVSMSQFTAACNSMRAKGG